MKRCAAILKEVEQKFPDVDLYVSFDSRYQWTQESCRTTKV